MKNDALNHFKEEMNKRGLFRKIQVCANLIPPPPGADGEALIIVPPPRSPFGITLNIMKISVM